MKKIFNTIIVINLLIASVLTSCSSPTPQTGSGSLYVLASTTILADIAQNVAGDRFKVESLLPDGADPHAYQAAPSDVKKLEDSNVLILNGLDYEQFIKPLLENAGGERLTIIATDGLLPDQMESEENPSQMVSDPHMWLDVSRAIHYAENIRDGFIKADPDGAETYKTNADAYIGQLKNLDSWIMEQVNTIPVEKRLLVTNHDAMGYFAERYGFKIVNSILPSFSSEASASAQDIAKSVEAIKASGTTAIFLDEIENAELANQVASETGVKVIDDLHLESLTDGGPASTYIDMMKYNVSRIVDALK
jgi:ABC-type Zn uptake system ZnuABC Zn-binding protein ZnuA